MVIVKWLNVDCSNRASILVRNLETFQRKH